MAVFYFYSSIFQSCWSLSCDHGLGCRYGDEFMSRGAADGSRPFHLYCDAGIDGFGAAIEQEQPAGSVRPVA